MTDNLIVEGQEYLFTEVEEFKVEMITESTKDGRALFVEGIAMQADVINANGRNYPRGVMTEAVDQYIGKYVSSMQALGECDHPPRPNVLLKEASHLIERLWIEGSDVYARARVMDTPNGLVVRALIEGGWIPRVSTRGLGKAVQVNESRSKFGRAYQEITKFQLTAGFDFVHNQSAPGAVMAGVYESNGHTYIPVTQKDKVDWDRISYGLRNLAGLNTPMIVESTAGDGGLKLSHKGGVLIIECDTKEWSIPVKELKKYLG